MLYQIVITAYGSKGAIFKPSKKINVEPQTGFVSKEEAKKWWLDHFSGFTELEADLKENRFFARRMPEKHWESYYGHVAEQKEEEDES